MRRFLFALVVTSLLAACGGSSSTGPQPTLRTITVTNSGFSPDSILVPTNTKVTWSVTEGTHNIRFTGNIPSGSNPESGEITAPASVSAIFLVTGTFTFDDKDNPAHTGKIVVQ